MSAVHEHLVETPGVNTRDDWKNTILAGLANYIDAGSIVAGSAALAFWVETYHLTTHSSGSSARSAPTPSPPASER